MPELIPVQEAFAIEGFYTAFWFDWNRNFCFDGESHNFWEVVFVAAGSVEVVEDENVYTLGEGNLIFHAPMEFHRIKSAGGSSPKGFIFSFSARGALPKTVTEGVLSVEPAQRSGYEALCNRIEQFVRGDRSPNAGMEAASLLQAFILQMASKRAVAVEATAWSALEYKRIASFLLKHVCENWTLEGIAAQTSVSVSYIKYLFHLYAGVSPKLYFNRLRIQRANELLAQGYSVAEVAGLMQFSSPSYFSSFYKRQVGGPPSQGRSN